jgi:acylphosphatase
VTAIRIVIHGRVQGVWFRAWTMQEARRRRLDGWVRNRSDGTVEAVFSGPQSVVDEMVAACREGPTMARVVHIDRHPHDGAVEPGFRQRSTA